MAHCEDDGHWCPDCRMETRPSEVRSDALLDIARSALQAEAVRRAAVAVVKEWQDGIITTKEGYGCGGLTISCLRDALGGYIPDDVMNDMPNAELSGGEAVRSDALLASLGALAEKWEKLGEECGGDYEDRSSFAFEQCAEELLETMKAND